MALQNKKKSYKSEKQHGNAILYEVIIKSDFYFIYFDHNENMLLNNDVISHNLIDEKLSTNGAFDVKIVL